MIESKPYTFVSVASCILSAAGTDNLTIIFLGQVHPRGKGAMRLTLYEAPTRERPEHRELRALLFARSVWVL